MASSAEHKTAAEWMARLRGERATQEDRDAYERWLEAHPENRAAATSLDQVWRSVGVLEDDPMVQAILATPPRQLRRGWQTFPALRLAAAVLLSLSLAAAWFTWRYLDTSVAYETASGQQRVVDLADGSRLHLNVKTRVEVALHSDVRDVRLVSGQAFFEVVPDPARPFVVTAGDKEITVLGTKFDVLLRGGDTRVTVIEGRVAVTSLGSTDADAPRTDSTGTGAAQLQPEAKGSEVRPADTHPAGATHRLELATRDAVSWPRSAPPSSLAPTAAIAAVEAWLSGRVVFDSTPLRRAVVELDRYTPVRVRLASAELGSMTVSGVFYVDRLADVDSLIFALEHSLPIVVERRGDELLLFASD